MECDATLEILLYSMYIMKKKNVMNTILECTPLLYLLFFATLVHLGYFMLLQDTQSVFIFCLVSIFVYLVIPNMIVVLAITLLFVDMLYIVNVKTKTTQEGFSGSVTFKDTSGIDISANDFIERAMTKKPVEDEEETTSKNRDKNKDEYEDNCEDDAEYKGNTLDEVNEESKEMKKVIEKIKSISPEVVDSLKTLNGIDISELNKLINNMNKIATKVSK